LPDVCGHHFCILFPDWLVSRAVGLEKVVSGGIAEVEARLGRAHLDGRWAGPRLSTVLNPGPDFNEITISSYGARRHDLLTASACVRLLSCNRVSFLLSKLTQGNAAAPCQLFSELRRVAPFCLSGSRNHKQGWRGPALAAIDWTRLAPNGRSGSGMIGLSVQGGPDERMEKGAGRRTIKTLGR